MSLKKWVDWLKTEAVDEILAKDVGLDATVASVEIIPEEQDECNHGRRLPLYNPPCPKPPTSRHLLEAALTNDPRRLWRSVERLCRR